MKTAQATKAHLILLSAYLMLSTTSQDTAWAQTSSKVSTPTKTAAHIKFRPQTTGAASVRVTGGSRGTGESLTVLDVLAPEEVGITTQEYPSLLWFQSRPADAGFELTVLQDKVIKPLLRVSIEPYSRCGIQRLNLADYGLKLEPGIEYQWVVALVTDRENRSTDLVASGTIKRIEPASVLKEQVVSTPAALLPALYAEAGIWYDALALLSDQIEADPTNTELRRARADLLRQIGLKQAAGADERFFTK